MKQEKNIKRGKASRASGAAFELRVRADLQLKDWNVCKYPNNLEDGKIIPAKHRFSPKGGILSIGTGFPDFLAHRNLKETERGKSIVMTTTCEDCRTSSGVRFNTTCLTEVIGVECKVNGKLSKVEQEKCHWYLNNKIFSKILIASKTKEGHKVVIEYENFQDKYAE